MIAGFGVFRTMRDPSFRLTYSMNINGKLASPETTKTFDVDLKSENRVVKITLEQPVEAPANSKISVLIKSHTTTDRRGFLRTFCGR